jgi:DUF1365 family protein
MIPPPGLYKGTLRHRRFAVKPHSFTYGLFLAWLDIDRIPETMAATPFTACNRFAWASFDDRDHQGDTRRSLRERLAGGAGAQRLHLPAGPIYLLTNLRYLGYCFNPISLYYCYGREGEIELIVAEVNNTFGESCCYWLTPDRGNGAGTKSLRFRCPKTMHVSPFLGMDLDYEFAMTRPGTDLVVQMNTIERGQRRTALDATLRLHYEPWSTATVGAALARHPWMTAKVIAAIHWEALRLWLQRVPVFPYPASAERIARWKEMGSKT